MSEDTEEQAKGLRGVAEQVAQIQGVTKETDFDWDKFLKKPVPRLQLVWFVLSVACFAVVLIVLLYAGFSLLGFMLGIGCCGWLVFCVHQRWESTGGAIVAFVTAVLLLLLASGLITPKETAEQAKGFIKRQGE